MRRLPRRLSAAVTARQALLRRGGLPYGHGGSGGAEDDDDEAEEEEEEKPKKGKKGKKKKDADEDEEEPEEEEKPKKGKKGKKKKDDEEDDDAEDKPKKKGKDKGGKEKKPKKKPKPIRILCRVGGFKSADEATTLAASMSLAGDERPEKLRDALTSDYVLTAKAGTAVVPPKDKKTFNDAREAQDKVRPAEVDVVAFAITLADVTTEAEWGRVKGKFPKEFASAIEVDAKQLDELKVESSTRCPSRRRRRRRRRRRAAIRPRRARTAKGRTRRSCAPSSTSTTPT